MNSVATQDPKLLQYSESDLDKQDSEDVSPRIPPRNVDVI